METRLTINLSGQLRRLLKPANHRTDSRILPYIKPQTLVTTRKYSRALNWNPHQRTNSLILLQVKLTLAPYSQLWNLGSSILF